MASDQDVGVHRFYEKIDSQLHKRKFQPTL